MCTRCSFSSDLIRGSLRQIAVPECAIEPYKAHLFERPSGGGKGTGGGQDDGVPIKNKAGCGGAPYWAVIWVWRWGCTISIHSLLFHLFLFLCSFKLYPFFLFFYHGVIAQ